ncbi:MAG: acyltransferase [Lamprobacter sp.]|uniref:acyltransferase family protein n=1 Tax=Lamprobacter sp. TaxID=3100796 RepID=UPI002B25D4C9|nr:acyltransferase [Lamprobacter sp.]MEA3638334.1 acyltransferase [Lamprobacter sp.]
MIEGQRNSGLDLFRFAAIGLVLMSHSRHIFEWYDIPGWNWWWLSVGGYLGVEIFFVLSGFLIGRILFRDVFFTLKPAWNSLWRFFIRRWFRTLPMYYLVLLVTFFISIWQGGAQHASWLHLFFLQNFNREALTFFPVSWSLSVEEWFYLLIPLSIWCILQTGASLGLRKPPWGWLIPAMIILTVLVRAYTVSIFPDLTWGDVRKTIFLRFDSLLLGVFGAYVNLYHSRIFLAIAELKFLLPSLFGISGLIAYYYILGQSGLDSSFFAKAFMFNLTSCFLLPPLAYCTLRCEFRSLGVTYGSVLSYGIYLIHFQFLRHFIQLSNEHHKILVSIGLWLVFLSITVFVSFLLYRFYEYPVMRIRDRFS